LYLHTGAQQGHFLANVQHDPRICVEVSENGVLHKGKHFVHDSALVYTSGIVFDPVRILSHDWEKRSWFLDRVLVKHGPSRVFEPDSPLIDQIILFDQADRSPDWEAHHRFATDSGIAQEGVLCRKQRLPEAESPPRASCRGTASDSRILN
jgi:hypothetical protein